MKKAVLAIAGILVLTVNLTEDLTYPNFIYSHFHFSPLWLNTLFGLGVTGYWAPNILRQKLPAAISAALLLAIGLTAAGTPEITGKALARAGLVISRFDWTKEQKYRAVWGNRADFFRFVKDTTPATARILIPLETLPWRYTGNSQFLGALLYPRPVVTTTRSNYQSTYQNYDYLIISSETDGLPTHIWPDFSVRAEKIIIYDWATGRGVEYTGRDWDPGQWLDQSPWGLIVPKKL